MHPGHSNFMDLNAVNDNQWTWTDSKPVAVEHITSPLALKAGPFYNPFIGKKKWGVVCGCCHRYFEIKLLLGERLAALCQDCKAMNIWTYNRWKLGKYQKHIC